jgi:hypothetical protein
MRSEKWSRSRSRGRSCTGFRARPHVYALCHATGQRSYAVRPTGTANDTQEFVARVSGCATHPTKDKTRLFTIGFRLRAAKIRVISACIYETQTALNTPIHHLLNCKHTRC